ncbi:MAG: hypothetical protein PVG39_00025 [Desulfobacteraceae bacterium]|jgi:hypothetical protein
MKAKYVDFYMKKTKILLVYFDSEVGFSVAVETFKSIKKKYKELDRWDRVPTIKNAIYLQFKNADAAMDFYKNWKRVLEGEK